ncbi:hypothetical protein GWC95_06490 [Sediminibacterium roseum]|uniref:Natural product n=1 Tax=Sediminibacterium roseum TaxID=1978412 RepID=A0ABW9ZR25_9BACT|nr:hypothetical protein [Sediminibacterium roseum]NCI49562.1 hypothetical protein [Sediminibacterium roseum]
MKQNKLASLKDLLNSESSFPSGQVNLSDAFAAAMFGGNEPVPGQNNTCDNYSCHHGVNDGCTNFVCGGDDMGNISCKNSFCY